MHASIVVLSALVAVTSAQYGWGWGVPYTGFNHVLGVPMDEPAVAAGKMFNAQQHAIRGSPTYVLRKRREASAPEAAAPADNAEEEAQPDKRQILAYSGLGYTGWSSPYWGGYGYSAYSPFLFRKRRDTAAEETPAHETAAMEEAPKEKRQIGYWGGWAGAYSPYMRTIYGGGVYGGYPYLFRKRRDVSEQPEHPEQTAAEEQTKDKRQVFYGGYAGWGYPTAYSGYYPAFGRSFLWRKRRDTTEQAAEENTSDDRSKRQFFYGSPLAYSAYTPYMAGYGYGLGYRGLFY